MSTKPQDVAETADTAPPPRPAGPAVIRRTEVAEEDVNQRVMNRHVPAWVISGAVHVVVIGMAVLFLSGPDDLDAKPNDLVTTNVEEPKEEEPNLVNEDVGFDAELPAATDSQLEKDVNVTAPDNPMDAAGIPDQPHETAPQTQVAGVGDTGAGVEGPLMDAPGAAAGWAAAGRPSPSRAWPAGPARPRTRC